MRPRPHATAQTAVWQTGGEFLNAGAGACARCPVRRLTVSTRRHCPWQCDRCMSERIKKRPTRDHARGTALRLVFWFTDGTFRGRPENEAVASRDSIYVLDDQSILFLTFLK